MRGMDSVIMLLVLRQWGILKNDNDNEWGRWGDCSLGFVYYSCQSQPQAKVDDEKRRTDKSTIT